MCLHPPFGCRTRTPGPVSLVLGVIAFCPTRCGLYGWPHVLDTAWKSHRLQPGRVGPVLHPSHELPTHFGNAPPFFHGLSSSIWRMVKGELSAQPPPRQVTAAQLVCPSGASLRDRVQLSSPPRSRSVVEQRPAPPTVCALDSAGAERPLQLPHGLTQLSTAQAPALCGLMRWATSPDRIVPTLSARLCI